MKANDKEKHQKPWSTEESRTIFFNVMNENNCQPRILQHAKISFKNESETKTVSDEGKQGIYCQQASSKTNVKEQPLAKEE